jgi:hypothetical protein
VRAGVAVKWGNPDELQEHRTWRGDTRGGRGGAG